MSPEPVSSSAAWVAVAPVRTRAGSNRSSNRSPLGVSDLMYPKTEIPRGSHEEAALEGFGEDEAAPASRSEAKPAAARIATSARMTSESFFMTPPLLIVCVPSSSAFATPRSRARNGSDTRRGPPRSLGVETGLRHGRRLGLHAWSLRVRRDALAEGIAVVRALPVLRTEGGPAH